MAPDDVTAPNALVPLPGQHPATVAVAAPGKGDGFWAGGPSAAVNDDGTVYLAYRLRRPVGDGRGYAVAISRSDDGGVTFAEVARIPRDAFATDSLERPALVRRPDGGWRIYLSLATPGTLHWYVVAIDAEEPAAFDPAAARTVLDGGPHDALKDTVVHPGPDGWEMWVCLHQVADPGQADAMTTLHATSPDGLDWTFTGTVLAPEDPSGWDRRGTRIAAVVDLDGVRYAYYDGRASYAENWEERTGVARADEHGRFHAEPGGPLAVSPHASGALRYVDAIAVPGGLRLYYEASRADGAHDLLTEYAPRPS
jgi:hypothetical protein